MQQTEQKLKPAVSMRLMDQLETTPCGGAAIEIGHKGEAAAGSHSLEWQDSARAQDSGAFQATK